jgi:hypothetical protein
MKFHAPSFLLGVGVTAAYVATRTRMRPVAIELSALALYLSRLARSVAERQREDLEDLWAEVEENVRARARARREHDGAARPQEANGGS